MTLRKPRASKGILFSFSPERTKIRALLRKASEGNVFAFAQAATHYSNLISEYLYILGYVGAEERWERLERILVECWRYLPYTRRVSDFERFLQVLLEKAEPPETPRLPDNHPAACKLNHEERFLLAARVLEAWDIKAVKLALRWNKSEVYRTLAELKCKLAGFRLHMLKGPEILQVLRVNDLLEGEFSGKQARRIENELARQFHAHQFKVEWLSYRCELADTRLDMILTSEQVQQLSARLPELIKREPMKQPGLADSLINHVSFVRLPSPNQ